MSEREIFLEALEITTPEARAAYLQGACGRDGTLRRKVEELLKEHFSDDSLLAGSALEGERPGIAELPVKEAPAQMLGRYKLLEKLGEGGFGEVWMVEQREPVKRRVALKIIKLGMDSRQIVARFEAERQALAMMDHANIAKIFDAGRTDSGRPYFVMELVRGMKITEYCDQNQLPTRERLDLFIKVCHAIQHAHQKGIIHRDIKPSNILVTLHDGVPVPKVIDFGIAKATQQELTDKTLFTQFQQFIGTPAYISPEQAEMSGLDIDTRADIYSLGVLLYELLVGETPFDAKEMIQGGLDALRQIIREKEPLPPSTKLNTLQDDARTTAGKLRQTDVGRLVHQLQGDLDWIAMKCLEKDRTRRYETANGLASDIQRHLANEPVVARPPSRWYEFQKAVRRHKFGFTAAIALGLVLALGVIVSSWQAVRATRAEQEQTTLRRQAEEAGRIATKHEQLALEESRIALEQALLARRRFYAAQMNLAMQAWDANRPARTLQLLETLRPESPAQDLRGFEWFHLWGLCNARLRFAMQAGSHSVTKVAFSPDGKTFAGTGEDGTVHLWATNGNECFSSNTDPRWAQNALAFTPDGKTLVSGGRDGRVHLWNVSDGTRRSVLRTEYGSFRCLAVSPDGALAAAGQNNACVTIWNMVSGVQMDTLVAGTRPVSAVEFSRNGLLASASGWGGTVGSANKSNKVILWDMTLSPPQPKLELPGARALAFSFEGSMLAAVGTIPIRLWDTTTGGSLGEISDYHADISSLVLLRDGRLIACIDDQTLREWQLQPPRQESATNQIIGTHLDRVSCVAVSPDETLAVSGARDGSVKLWNLSETRSHAEARYATSFQCGMEIISLVPLRRSAAVWISSHEGAEIRDLNSGQRLKVIPKALGRIALSPDEKILVSANVNGRVRFWETATGREVTNHLAHSDGWDRPALVFSSDGRMLATAGISDSEVKLWNLEQGVTLAEPSLLKFAVGPVAISPDSKKLAAILRSGRAVIVDLQTRQVERDISLGDPVTHHAAEFSPDGTLLVVAGDSGVAQIWNVKTGQLHAKLWGHQMRVSVATFSPDGNTLATAADDGVRLWDVATGQERVSFNRHLNHVRSLAFTPDGNMLVSGDRRGTVWVLRRPPIEFTEVRSGPMTPKR